MFFYTYQPNIKFDQTVLISGHIISKVSLTIYLDFFLLVRTIYLDLLLSKKKYAVKKKYLDLSHLYRRKLLIKTHSKFNHYSLHMKPEQANKMFSEEKIKSLH